MLRVCQASEVKDKSIRKFSVNDREIVIGRYGGKLFASDNSCPHKGASMHKGYYKNGRVVCYLHDYEFDINSGKLANIPDRWKKQSEGWKKAGNLVMHHVTEDSDYIYVELDDKRVS